MGGFVAGEGSFFVSGEPPTFTFAVSLGAVDTMSCEAMRDFFQVGSLHWSARRRPDYDDEIAFHVRAFADLLDVIVPFMDEHLPRSYKRTQYEAWRAQLLDYWEHRAKRVRPCSVPGCDDPRRAKGLCRHHYYVAYGR